MSTYDANADGMIDAAKRAQMMPVMQMGIVLFYTQQERIVWAENGLAKS